MLKVAWLVRLSPSREHDEALREGNEDHARLVSPFDGFSEAWFRDRETFEAAHEADAWWRLRDDSPNLFDVDARESGVNCVVEERVLKG